MFVIKKVLTPLSQTEKTRASIASPMSISPILALSQQVNAVLLCFAFYLLNLLVPIIPAAFIYWLFGTKTSGVASKQAGDSVEGTIWGFKIKAVGAWAAYVTALVIGFWLIRTTAVPLITAVGGASVWQIDSDFKFMDETGKEITDTVDKLEVEPPKVKPWGKHATITVFSETLSPPDQVQIKLAGYDYETVEIGNSTIRGNKIKLSPITFKRVPLPAAPISATPFPAGQGPAALTANK
jgi:hypothetical protein